MLVTSILAWRDTLRGGTPCVAGHPAWRDTFRSGPPASNQCHCTKSGSTHITLYISLFKHISLRSRRAQYLTWCKESRASWKDIALISYVTYIGLPGCRLDQIIVTSFNNFLFLTIVLESSCLYKHLTSTIRGNNYLALACFHPRSGKLEFSMIEGIGPFR
jgi:hypothetical protein